MFTLMYVPFLIFRLQEKGTARTEGKELITQSRGKTKRGGEQDGRMFKTPDPVCYLEKKAQGRKKEMFNSLYTIPQLT